MAGPQRQNTAMKVRMRQAQHKAELPATTTCPECGAPVQTHRACPSCGKYRGRQVLTVDTAKD